MSSPKPPAYPETGSTVPTRLSALCRVSLRRSARTAQVAIGNAQQSLALLFSGATTHEPCPS